MLRARWLLSVGVCLAVVLSSLVVTPSLRWASAEGHVWRAAVPVVEHAMPISKPPTQAALSAFLVLSQGRVEVGRSDPFTATLRLTAREDVRDITARLTLPLGVIYVAEGADERTHKDDHVEMIQKPGQRELIWQIGDLAAGATFSDALKLMVTESITGAQNLMFQPVITAADLAVESLYAPPAILQVGVRIAREQMLQLVAQGGRFEVGERIQVEFAPGSVRANEAGVDDNIYGVVYAPFVPRVDEERVLIGDFRLPFELGPDMEFDAPVTLTINLSGLLPSQMLAERQPVVQYLRPEQVTRTIAHEGDRFVYTYTTRVVEDLPSHYDAASGLLRAQLSHFSEYQVGLKQPSDPQPWKLDGRGSDVGLFAGSAEYAYPIDLPAMHDNLQPVLNVRYSSAAADAQWDQDHSPGEGLSLGQGWRMDTPKITRRVKRRW